MSIKEAIVALANKIKGETNLTAPSIAGAIGLVTENFPGAATTTKAGLVKQAAAVADAASAPTKTEYNNLLAALRTAGIIAPNS